MIISCLGNYLFPWAISLIWLNFSCGRIIPKVQHPLSIGNCTSLQFLFLFSNFLSSSIPRQPFDIRSLVFPDLSNNSFEGNLPFEVGQLQKLNSFNVSLNRISGEIPSSLKNCKSLVFLNLSSNSLVGTIPMSLEALVATEEVDLSK